MEWKGSYNNTRGIYIYISIYLLSSTYILIHLSLSKTCLLFRTNFVALRLVLYLGKLSVVVLETSIAAIKLRSLVTLGLYTLFNLFKEPGQHQNFPWNKFWLAQLHALLTRVLEYYFDRARWNLKMPNIKITFKMKSMLWCYHDDFNTIKYQYSHFCISRFVYIRMIQK